MCVLTVAVDEQPVGDLRRGQSVGDQAQDLRSRGVSTGRESATPRARTSLEQAGLELGVEHRLARARRP